MGGQSRLVGNGRGSGSGIVTLDRMGRKKDKDVFGQVRKETPLYSRDDIYEQYCISSGGGGNGRNREIQNSTARARGFFGLCLSARKVSVFPMDD